MIFYPAIDLKNGQVVRLTQGRADAVTVYFEDAAEPAAAWRKAGAEWIHVVDLDGAFTGETANAAALARIIAAGSRVQFGGGMRSREAVARALEAGVERVVIGTRAAEEPAFVDALVSEFGAEHIAVGIDARDGKVAVKGWVETSDLGALELARTMQRLGVRTLIYTDISRDGMLTGPNFEAQTAMLEAVPEVRVIASGGVSQDADIERFAAMAKDHANLDGVIVGRALYENTVDLSRHLRA